MSTPLILRRRSPRPKRFDAPPEPLSAVLEFDAVLISHDRYDHLGRSAIRSLAQRPVRFINTFGVGTQIEYWGVPAECITELDRWESATLSPRDVVSTATSSHLGGG